MQITPQTNREGLAPFAAHRLGHEPSALFWLLVDMVDKCPAISLQFARSMYKDTSTSAEIRYCDCSSLELTTACKRRSDLQRLTN